MHAPIIEAITTAETSFFRDGHLFEAFRTHLLPRLVEKARRGAKVRIWCARGGDWAGTVQPSHAAVRFYPRRTPHPCLWRENRRPKPAPATAFFPFWQRTFPKRCWPSHAQGSTASRDAARGLTPALLARYCERRGAAWVVREPVRRMVEFRRLNLTGVLPDLYSFDAIFCRNLLIYFDLDTRRRVCRGLHDHLFEEGWLVLGQRRTSTALPTSSSRFVSRRPRLPKNRQESPSIVRSQRAYSSP